MVWRDSNELKKHFVIITNFGDNYKLLNLTIILLTVQVTKLLYILYHHRS